MKFIATTLFAVILLAYGCNSRNDSKYLDLASSNTNKQETNANDKMPKSAESAGYNVDSTVLPISPDKKKQIQKTTDQQTVNPDWDKKIVKTASIDLEVKEYNSFYTSLREKVRSMGGYIAQEEQTQSDYKISNNMVIKVPVDQFDNAVLQLTANVQKINERKIISQDVTTEVVDTKSRIEAKKQVRQRYMDLLGQAKNMQDILSVQSEINGVQEEIESAAGRVEYLNHSSVFSTINLSYYQVLNASAKETDQPVSPSFGEKVKDALKTGWEIISNLVIVVITIWPLLLASFLLFILYKKYRRQKVKA